MKTVDQNHRDVTQIEEGAVFVIDKPLHWSSTDVVRKLKFALHRRGYRRIKIGHAGTLDPLATGILLLCVGKATKSVDELQAQRKEYVAQVTLGATTPSYDLEHPIDAHFPHEHITREAIEQLLLSLTGERLQQPPLYSAKMVDGRRAYELAREGSNVELRQALITIYSIDIVEYNHPILTLCVACSKGTYIRSLAMEIGRGLHSGAHLSGLCRTSSGSFALKDALKVEQALELIEQGA